MTKKYIQSLFRILGPIILTVLVIWLGLKSISLFWPFVVAYIIALSVSPLIDLFEKKCKIKPQFMSLILIALILGLIILFIVYVLSTMVNSLPILTDFIYKTLDSISKIELPFDLSFSTITKTLTDNISTIASYLTNLFGNTTSIISAVPDIFFKLIITILASYFLIADRKRISRFIFGKINESYKEKLKVILQESKVLINAYIISQIKLMFCVAIILTIGFLILKFKIATIVPLVAVIAFFDVLPIFGAGTILIPWFIYCFLTGNYHLGIGLLVLYLVITGFRQAASPKIVGQQIGIGAFPSLILMYVGYLIYGWVGLIVSVPVGVLIINLYNKHFFDSFIEEVKNFIKETKMMIKE